MATKTLLLGAVAYDPKVVTIWDGFKQHFAGKGLDFDYVLYSNYERQVMGQFRGEHHVAWNSPLAWIQAERVAEARGRKARAIAMRDTDCDLTSAVVVRADSNIHAVTDLMRKTVAVGAKDSPQATLIPLLHLARLGLRPDEDFGVRHFDVLVGKHGDHIGGERDAAKALMAKEVDACCILDGNHLAFSNEGTFPQKSTRILTQTGKYDHCNFTVLDDAPEDLIAQFTKLLFEMSYDDPAVRPLLDLEGLKTWRRGRISGYELLNKAVDEFSYLDRFLRDMSQ